MVSPFVMINTTAAPAGFNLVSATPASSNMIDRLNHSALFLLVLALGLDQVRADTESHAPATRVPVIGSSLFGSQPLQFELNRGQAEGPARFLARGVNYNFLIAPTEAQLILDNTRESPAAASPKRHNAPEG